LHHPWAKIELHGRSWGEVKLMKINGNTIVITGGGSGIGRGLAESFAARGNRVIVAGRRKEALEEVTRANKEIHAMTLDVDDPESIEAFAGRVAAEFPATNVLINNSGIMKMENLAGSRIDAVLSEAIVTTNLLGPIRLTAALLPVLKKQAASTVMMVSSGLAFVPMTITPTYCATKAAIHSYTQSLRYQLRGTTTEVLELIPPYVQTELLGPGQAKDPHAMPLAEFVAEVMGIIERGTVMDGEILVERVNPLRFAEAGGKYRGVFEGLNRAVAEAH
jgi:uncharacterized oxidoreductase